MNVSTITMHKTDAKAAYRNYLAQVKKNREFRKNMLAKKAKDAGKALGEVRIEKSHMEKEDEALAQAYRLLSKGEKILSLTSALATAGLNKQFLPNLAIVRADSPKVCVRSPTREEIVFSTTGSWRDTKRDIVRTTNLFDLDWRRTEWRREHGFPQLENVEAATPVVPPHLRPADLSKYHIMWEPNWQRRAPDPDPFLLSRISDDLFAVVAVWDMTPLELAIIEGRPKQ